MATKPKRTGLQFTSEGLVALSNSTYRTEEAGGVQSPEDRVEWISATSSRISHSRVPVTFQPQSLPFREAHGNPIIEVPRGSMNGCVTQNGGAQFAGDRLVIRAVAINTNSVESLDPPIDAYISINEGAYEFPVTIAAGALGEINLTFHQYGSGSAENSLYGYVVQAGIQAGIIEGISTLNFYANDNVFSFVCPDATAPTNFEITLIPSTWQVLSVKADPPSTDPDAARVKCLQYRVATSGVAPELFVDISRFPADTVIKSFWIRASTFPDAGIIYVSLQRRSSTADIPGTWEDVVILYYEHDSGDTGSFVCSEVDEDGGTGSLPYTLESGYEYRVAIEGEHETNGLLTIADIGIGVTNVVL